MIPVSLKIRNFMSYGADEVELDFRTFSIACLSGENGHGKSALLDSMLWALWGKCRVKTKEEVIRRGESEARVELEFEAEGVKYRVMRLIQRKKNGSASSVDLQVFDSESELYRPMATGAGVGAAIENILKMNYDAFICSSFILQGKADEFTKRSPAERKDVLAGILELEEYEYISKKAREEANSLTNRIQFLDAELGKLPVFEETEDEARDSMKLYLGDVELQRKHLEDCTSNVETMIQEQSALTVKLDGFSAKRAEVDSLASEETELVRKIETAKSAITAAETYRGKEAETLKRFARYNEVAEEREKLDAQYKAWVAAESRVKDIQRKIDTLTAEYERGMRDLEQRQAKQEALYDSLLEEDDMVCPTCKTVLNAEKRAMLLEQTAQALDDIRKEHAELDARTKPHREQASEEFILREQAWKERDEIGWDPAVKEKLDAEYRSLAKAPEEKSLLERAQVALEHHRQAFTDNETKLRATQLKRAALLAEIEESTAVTSRMKEVSTALSAARQSQEELKRAISGAEEGARKAERLLEDILKTTRRAQEINSEKEKYVRSQRVNVELSKAYGKNGLQALVIEHAVPDIEAEANEILAGLTDGRMSVALDMLKPTQKGGEKETLEIVITEGGEARSYETFSGGEAFRIDFALRVAISKFIANRSGAQLRTLVIDEGFGSQDRRGREYFVQAINAVKDSFDKVLAITHIDDLRDRFPVRIEVVKESEKGSTVEVIHA